MSSIEQLNSKKEFIKEKFLRFQKFVQNLDNKLTDVQCIDLEQRLYSIESLLSEYDNIQYEIKLASPNEYDAVETDLFVESFFTTVAKAKLGLTQQRPRNIDDTYSYRSGSPTSRGTRGSQSNLSIVKQDIQEKLSSNSTINGTGNSDGNTTVIQRSISKNTILKQPFSNEVSQPLNTQVNNNASTGVVNQNTLQAQDHTFFQQPLSNDVVQPLTDRLYYNTGEINQNKMQTAQDQTDVPRPYSNNISRSGMPVVSQVQGPVQVQGNNIQACQQIQYPMQFQGVKLPTIALPKFSGLFDQWLEFKNTFFSLIHMNPTIMDIQKLHYLKASLSGEAAQVVQSIPFSNDSYHLAWSILCSRYDNTRLLVHNHVKAIYNMESLSGEQSAKIRILIDTVQKNLRALHNLNQPTQHWDTLIIFIISTKFDHITAREWESYKSNNDMPTLTDLITFLKGRADLLETLEVSSQGTTKQNQGTSKQNQYSQNRSFLVQSKPCPQCKGSHAIYNCSDFLKLNTADRTKQLQQLRLCLNCLKYGHQARVCTAQKCRKCNNRHNTIIHQYYTPTKTTLNQEEKSNSENQPSEAKKETTTLNAKLAVLGDTASSEVLLSTALVKVQDKNGKYHTVRAVLDVGSQSNLITQDLCDKLKSDKIPIRMQMTGVGQTSAHVSYQTTLLLSNKYNKYSFEATCLVLPTITDYLPNVKFNTDALKIPKGLELADDDFNVPNKIEILLGASHFWDLLGEGRIKLANNKTYLQETKLGWIVGGPVEYKTNKETTSCNFTKIKNLDIQEQLQKFWEVEDIYDKPIKSKEDIECENNFKANMRRDEDGRFIVALPLKKSVELLGGSEEQARKRFYGLEKKFSKDENLKNQYIEFLNEYQELGHMREAKERMEKSFYMPHHGVKNDNSLTTKLRVVFNGSAPTTTGVSLNDLQMAGPVLQNDLFSILIRFRKHRYVISADVEKMYRQIRMTEEHIPLQRILMRSNPEEPLKTFELTTVTYGTTAGAFLSIRCLHELGLECKECNPNISRIILEDFYVDDLLSGSDSIKDCKTIVSQLGSKLQEAKFNLRKWISNEPKILNSETKGKQFGEQDKIKTLGLIWSSKEDILSYNIGTIKTCKLTKRNMLSETAQIFDPLGILAPVTVSAKILLQELWQENLGWDDELPKTLKNTWLNYRQDLNELNKLQIPRHVVIHKAVNFQLHGFADASERAYGACIYVKSENLEKNVKVELLCAKTKVCPLKTLTMPKLELCAALMLAKLMNKVVTSLKPVVEVDSVTFWSDSSIVLSWLKQSPHLLKIFVSNRIAEIQKLTSVENWKHVSSNDNPADLCSRGIRPQQIQHLELWWNGPRWLCKEEKDWPQSLVIEEKLPELKKQKYTTLSALEERKTINFTRFSDLNRLKNTVAYCQRFKKITLDKENIKGPILLEEGERALLVIIKIVQSEEYSEEIDRLQKGKTIKPKSKILSLSPCLENGILKVGGRLVHSEFEMTKKHPILLPGNHLFSKLVLRQEHRRLLHAGPQLLLAHVREKFWIVAGKNACKQIVHECLKCFRAKPRMIQPIMGNLPAERVTPTPIFYNTGVDYAGPFLVANKKGRGSKSTKMYVCLFVCFVTKIIHLELVTELSTQAFIMALRRFVARRGKPSTIFSDQGRNFIGAARELEELGQFLQINEESLVNSFSSEGVKFKFIPPYSPHIGGLWEAGVRSCKFHLKRVVSNSILSWEEFYTLLHQIEAVLNSRPISPLSSDPNDLLPLTPGHFLIGRPLTSLPDPQMESTPENRLMRYQKVQKLQQQFWSRWSTEYISELQQRMKWKENHGALREGCLVLIKEDNVPPLVWKLGRIIKLHPGTDQIARVATVKTSTGEVKRSFAKLCPFFDDSSK